MIGWFTARYQKRPAFRMSCWSPERSGPSILAFSSLTSLSSGPRNKVSFGGDDSGRLRYIQRTSTRVELTKSATQWIGASGTSQAFSSREGTPTSYNPANAGL
jgi:hypothetical protein